MMCINGTFQSGRSLGVNCLICEIACFETLVRSLCRDMEGLLLCDVDVWAIILTLRVCACVCAVDIYLPLVL
jgi:hypothetical protein